MSGLVRMAMLYLRVGAACAASALLAMAATTGALAQASDDPVAASGEQAQGASPHERYSTFVQMAGQIEDQLARSLERLPGGTIAGLVGEGGFVTEHVRMLRESAAAIEAGQTFPEARRDGHARAVLAFLDQATRLTRLINELENAETNGDGENATRLRGEIAELAKARLFHALVADAPARLVVTVEEPEPDAVYWPHAIHSFAVAIENRGDAPAAGVNARIEPEASVIADVSTPQGSCTAEIGEETRPQSSWSCQRGTLAAGESWPLAIALRHAAPAAIGAGPAEEARVTVIASASSPAIAGASASTGFSVANCSANYHRQLEAMRPNEAQRLLDRLGDMRHADPALPGRWLTRKVNWQDEEVAELVARAEQIAVAGGAERWLAAQASDGAIARVVYGLRGYVRQGLFPALCTGADLVVTSYRGFLDEFDRRRQANGADGEMTLALADAATGRFLDLQEVAVEDDQPGEAEDGAAPVPLTLDAVVARFAAGAGIELTTGAPENPERPGDRLAALKALADAPLADIATGEDALAAGREALSLIETAFYFAIAAERYATLARSFDDMLAGIANASAAECRCRTGNASLAPTTAAVPVSGIEAPGSIVPPRPKPALEGTVRE